MFPSVTRERKGGMPVWLLIVIVIANLALVALSNISFKFSAISPDWRRVLFWQLIGNIAGFGGVITFTLALRQIPLSIAFALSAGLGFVLVEVVGALLIFHETITTIQWLGVALVTGGIVLISQGR